mmetsp:Transcript_10548/g.35783  ORF Transcript_10548/g.35783 Transcript_10548/m.35783 type:complete len:209 (+) Transcript_10548:732-1358(+)
MARAWRASGCRPATAWPSCRRTTRAHSRPPWRNRRPRAWTTLRGMWSSARPAASRGRAAPRGACKRTLPRAATASSSPTGLRPTRSLTARPRGSGSGIMTTALSGTWAQARWGSGHFSPGRCRRRPARPTRMVTRAPARRGSLWPRRRRAARPGALARAAPVDMAVAVLGRLRGLVRDGGPCTPRLALGATCELLLRTVLVSSPHLHP